MHSIILPATHPDELGFGRFVQNREWPWPATLVQFSRQVWYNAEIREAAWQQMATVCTSGAVLVGFSKSGLGALNIALEHPQAFSACVCFDAPLGAVRLPGGDAGDFFQQELWSADLPMQKIDALAELSQQVRLLHIGGALFHHYHAQFAEALASAGGRQEYVHRPDLAHHWESGWLDLVAHRLH